MAPTRFAFVDEGEALRRLNVDRDTLQALVREGRLKAHGVGIHHYYRTKDIDALYAELYGEDAGADAAPVGKGPAGTKLFDPAYKVHVRLQADLKWYDLTDDDLRAWAREMTEDGYPRQRANIEMVIGKLQRMVNLMDEAAATWRVLKPAHPVPSTTMAPSERETTSAKPAESRRGKPLAMLGTASAPVPAPAPAPMPAPPTPPAQPAATSRRGRPLPLAGAPRPAEPPTPADE